MGKKLLLLLCSVSFLTYILLLLLEAKYFQKNVSNLGQIILFWLQQQFTKKCYLKSFFENTSSFYLLCFRVSPPPYLYTLLKLLCFSCRNKLGFLKCKTKQTHKIYDNSNDKVFKKFLSPNFSLPKKTNFREILISRKKSL